MFSETVTYAYILADFMQRNEYKVQPRPVFPTTAEVTKTAAAKIRSSAQRCTTTRCAVVQ